MHTEEPGAYQNKDNVKVVIRIRPHNERERSKESITNS
jgi:hypothetical protein